MQGVILGVEGQVSALMAQDMIKRLNLAFPNVRFVIVPYADSVTFEFTPEFRDGKDTYDLIYNDGV